jgi:hypothetical protein
VTTCRTDQWMRKPLRAKRRIQAGKPEPAQIISCHQGGGFVALGRESGAGLVGGAESVAAAIMVDFRRSCVRGNAIQRRMRRDSGRAGRSIDRNRVPELFGRRPAGDRGRPDELPRHRPNWMGWAGKSEMLPSRNVAEATQVAGVSAFISSKRRNVSSKNRSLNRSPISRSVRFPFSAGLRLTNRPKLNHS